MKSKMLPFFLAFIVLLSSCEKKTDKPFTEMYARTISQNSNHGHLKQAKDFSSEVVLDWMNMQLQLVRTTPGMPPATNSRLFAYTGIALYESVVPGMPSFQSLSGQLTDMPPMPSADAGYAYHWAASANAALAYITEHFFPNTSDANKQSIKDLQNTLNEKYKTEVQAETFDRSVAFGQAVAQSVFEWSRTDGSATIWPAYTPPVGAGLWASTYPNFPAASTPYWGRNRLFVPGSLDQSDPTLPPTYSIDPNSAYYRNMKEVYDISQTLTSDQLAQALYYRDSPGYVSGGHYLSILYQLFQKQQYTLDFSSTAYAKCGIAVADALIGCFQWKYKDLNGGPVTNTERPVTYIRGVMGYNWNSKFNTPPHPDFPSGHATTAGAAEVIFTSLFGDHYAFTNHTYDYLNMPAQSYTSFTDMADQISMSRVYAGIHTRFACDAGRVEGQQIARNILQKVKFMKE